jgi:hypothetical protein
MINHISIGVREVGAAGKFYDAAVMPLGYKRLYDSAEALGYGADSPELWVMRAERPVPDDDCSGLHICLDASSRAAVDAFHTAALRPAGATTASRVCARTTARITTQRS